MLCFFSVSKKVTVAIIKADAVQAGFVEQIEDEVKLF